MTAQRSDALRMHVSTETEQRWSARRDWASAYVGRLGELGLNHKPVPFEVGLWGGARPAGLLRAANIHDRTQPLHRALLPCSGNHTLAVLGALPIFGWLITKDLRAREAHTPKELDCRVQEGDVVHGLDKLQVAKVARALLLVHAAGATWDEAVDGAQRQVHQPTRHSLAIFECPVSGDFAHRRCLQLLRSQDAKLHLADLFYVSITVTEHHGDSG
jgi:hypothetical protein